MYKLHQATVTNGEKVHIKTWLVWQ